MEKTNMSATAKRASALICVLLLSVAGSITPRAEEPSPEPGTSEMKDEKGTFHKHGPENGKQDRKERRRGKHHVMHRFWENAELTEKLSLTAEQIEHLRLSMETTREMHQELQSLAKETHRNLRDVENADSPDAEQVAELEATLEEYREARKTLGDKQREAFQKILNEDQQRILHKEMKKYAKQDKHGKNHGRDRKWSRDGDHDHDKMKGNHAERGKHERVEGDQKRHRKGDRPAGGRGGEIREIIRNGGSLDDVRIHLEEKGVSEERIERILNRIEERMAEQP
jgi:hypothetical protein